MRGSEHLAAAVGLRRKTDNLNKILQRGEDRENIVSGKTWIEWDV